MGPGTKASVDVLVRVTDWEEREFHFHEDSLTNEEFGKHEEGCILVVLRIVPLKAEGRGLADGATQVRLFS